MKYILFFFSLSLYANILTVKIPFKENSTSYKVHLGKEPGNYYFNYLLGTDHYKNSFVYSFLFLEDGETYYIAFSYDDNGVRVKSKDLKITAPVLFPSTPKVRLK